MSDLDLDAMWQRVGAIGDELRAAGRSLDSEIRALAAEVERLKANQRAGGEWRDEYWRETEVIVLPTHRTPERGDTHHRRVWTSPTEPWPPAESESKPSDTPGDGR